MIAMVEEEELTLSKFNKIRETIMPSQRAADEAKLRGTFTPMGDGPNRKARRRMFAMYKKQQRAAEKKLKRDQKKFAKRLAGEHFEAFVPVDGTPTGATPGVVAETVPTVGEQRLVWVELAHNRPPPEFNAAPASPPRTAQQLMDSLRASRVAKGIPMLEEPVVK